jgi:hypothetical protein
LVNGRTTKSSSAKDDILAILQEYECMEKNTHDR